MLKLCFVYLVNQLNRYKYNCITPRLISPSLFGSNLLNYCYKGTIFIYFKIFNIYFSFTRIKY